MPPKRSQNRAYKKEQPYKDARRFVIICEGERESEYFDCFNGKSKKIIIETLDPTGEYAGLSAPNHLYDRAQVFFEANGLDNSYEDNLCFVLDVDRWNRNSIEELIQLVHGKENWGVFISNPCFEVWLLYHKDKKRLVGKSSGQMKQILDNSIKGGYNSNVFAKLILVAVENASINDPSPQSVYPDDGVTKVYKLANEIIKLMGLHRL